MKRKSLIFTGIVFVVCFSVFLSLLCVDFNSADANSTVTEDGKICAYYMDGSAGASVEYGTFTELGNASGVKATFTRAKDSAVLRRVIDLNDYSENDKLISVMPMPKNYGTADFDRIYVRFIDVYDESNFISLQYSCNPGMLNTSNVGYALAYASNGQKPKGKDKYSDRIWTNQYGCYTFFQFYGAKSNYAANALAIYFDIKTNKIYVWDNNTTRKYLIADFDDNTYFGEDVWNGFTTGEVYVKVSVDGFQESDTASLLVNYYGGTDLSERYIDNSEGAKIEIDFGDYSEEDYPNAIEGNKYPIFDASAFDYYTGYATVEKSVYYNYFSSNRQKIVISKDGSFTPPVAGDFHILYEATNGMGVKSSKALKITAEEKSANGLRLMVDGYETSVTIGEKYYFPSVSYTGNKGKVNIDYSIINEGKKLTAENGFVRPVKTGEMYIVVSARDYIGQTSSKTISVSVKATDRPTFVEEPVLPKYFVSGNTYLLPQIKAYNYVDESAAEVPTKIKVSENGSADKVLNGLSYIPNVSTSGNVVITYYAEISGKTSEITKTVPVYNTKISGKLDMGAYFLTDANGSVKTETNCVMFQTAGVGSSFTFINSIYSTDFSCEFLATSSTSNIGKLNIRLVDYYDSDNQLKFTYLNDGTGVTFYMNDDMSLKSSLPKDFSEGNIISLTFSTKYKTVSYDVSSNRSFSIAENIAGDEFKGFTDNKFYVVFETESVIGNAEIALRKLNGMFFSNATRDYIGPSISFKGDFNFQIIKGETVELSEALIFDVLDGEREGTVTVVSPDDEIPYSVGGLLLSNVPSNQVYSLKCDLYGVYFVNYSATDTYGNRLNFSYVINVIDKEKPVIELADKIVENVTVGDKIYIPEAKVKDDNSQNLSCKVFVILSDGSIVEIDRDNVVGIVAKTSGTYRIIYFTKDEEGNTATKVYSVNVKEN